MEDEIEDCIRKKIQWPQLPATVKKLLGDSPKEYERYIFEFSIKNQLRFRGSLVRTVRKDEKKYYETLVQCSIQRLMLYPYHLADMIVKGLRITPFIYYVEVVALLIEMEKSYDTMPNFTAADCLRLLGIGRNEYLELVAKSRSLGRRGRSKAIRGLLPKVPMNIPMQPWWRVELGYVLEEDVKPLSESEKALIDLLIDRGSQTAGTLDYNVVKTLYRRGLIYLDVPITAEDRVSVPPLKGFVMNRIAGDYFETLLYKVFVSIDEHTTVAELANVLQVECELVKQAVSLYCRVGFAHHLRPPPATLHPSWRHAHTHPQHPPYRQITPLTYDPSTDDDVLQMEPVLITQEPSTSKQNYDEIVKDNSNTVGGRRVAVLFDSTLAAYLMMGNLSPDLKSHAVTLFEVGKLCDESLGSLLMELDKVAADPEIEGEARRYLAAARCLRIALRTLRPKLKPLDLLRCEALHALGTQARARLLATKYRLAISTAPLCREARAGLAAGSLPHLGPAPAESHTPWMRLYLYHVAGYGPPTILLTKGTVLRCVPRALLGYSRLWVWWWGSDSTLEGGAALSAPAALRAANLALRRAPVMLQAAAVRTVTTPVHLMFPPTSDTSDTQMQSLWNRHAGLRRLVQRLRLHRSIGYVTLADIGVPDLGCAHPPAAVQLVPPRKRKEICGIAKPVSEISLSSTDSTEKTTADYTKRLQSPIESHFAVTPTIDSKASSPANGFTSAECGQLLCEELDNLAIDSTKASHQSKESIAGSDDIVPINSLSTSIEDLKEKADDIKRHVAKSMSKESITCSDDLVPINSSSVSIENLKFDSKKSSFSEKSIGQFNDLMSPAEESVSMFTQLSNKLTEMTAEGDSGVDTAHNFSDEETCKPEKWTILDLQFGIPLFDESLCEKICNFIVEKIANPDILDTVKEDNDFIRADVLKFVSQCQYYPGEDMGIVKRGTLVPLPRKNLVFENGRISEWTGK